MKEMKKGSIALYAVLLVAVIAIMVALRPHTTGSAAAVKHSGGDTLDVGIEYSPSYCYTIADTLGGFHHDLMLDVARQMRRAVKFHLVVNAGKAIDALNAGSLDVAIIQYPMTKENQNLVEFTKPVCLDRQILVQRRLDNGELAASSQLALAHDTVWVVKNSPMRERIAHLSREIGDTIFVREDSTYGPEQLFLRVAGGEIKYAVINEAIARSLSKEYPQVDFSTGISFTQHQAWLLRKGNTALRDTLNAHLP